MSMSGYRSFLTFRAVVGVLCGVLLGVLAGCGGDGGDDGTPVAAVCGHPTGTKSQIVAGPYLYVTEQAASGQPGLLYPFQTTANGPVALGGSPLATGVDPESIAYDAGGQHLYVANRGDSTVSQYAVSSNGSLMPLSPATVRFASYTVASGGFLTAHPSGCFLYVAGIPPEGAAAVPVGLTPQSFIAQFSVASDGSLHPLSPATVSVVAFAGGPLTIDASGQHAYLPGTDATGGVVIELNIGADGGLTYLATVRPQGQPAGVTLAPNGGTAYVWSSCAGTECDGLLTPYPVGATGGLSPAGTPIDLLHGTDPLALAITSTGSSAYLLTHNSAGIQVDDELQWYSIDGTGALTFRDQSTPGGPPIAGGLALLDSDLYTVSTVEVVDGTTVTLTGFAGRVDHYNVDSVGLLTPLDHTLVGSSTATAMTVLRYIPSQAAY